MTQTVIGAALLLAALGLILGLVLAGASMKFAVPVDEKAKAIEEELAGANCGACGYSGCAGYAAALSSGACTDCGLCSPGGAKTAKAVAAILGVEAAAGGELAAVVLCRGDGEHCGRTMDYSGSPTCREAAQLFGGGKACSFGCLGLGDCVRACPYSAIRINEKGLAEVEPELCKACKLCIKTCPKGVIELLPKKNQAVVLCRNKNKGADTRKACSLGCLGCGKCMRSCPAEAVTVDSFLASVDPEKCTACGACAAGCPAKCISLMCENGKL